MGPGTYLGGLEGLYNQYAAKEANKSMQGQYKAAMQNISSDAIAKRFGNMQEMYSPFLNAIASNQAIAGQSAARGMQGSLARAGLGSTGMGSAMGAGAQQGAAMGGSVLRAQMLQDLLRESIGLQQSRANMIMGMQQPVQANPIAPVRQGMGMDMQMVGQMAQSHGIDTNQLFGGTSTDYTKYDWKPEWQGVPYQ